MPPGRFSTPYCEEIANFAAAARSVSSGARDFLAVPVNEPPQKVPRDFGEEPRRLGGTVSAILEAQRDVAQIDCTLGASDSDIEETPFLFQLLGVFLVAAVRIRGAAVGEDAVFHPGDEYVGEFKAL